MTVRRRGGNQRLRALDSGLLAPRLPGEPVIERLDHAFVGGCQLAGLMLEGRFFQGSWALDRQFDGGEMGGLAGFGGVCRRECAPLVQLL